MEVINERFARNIRVGLFNLMRRSPEVSASVASRCRSSAPFCARSWCRRTSTSSPSSHCAAAGLIVCDPNLVFAVIDALFGGAGKFHTRIEGRDFSRHGTAGHQPPGRDHDAPNTNAPGTASTQMELEYQRSEMQPQFANIATPSEIVVSTARSRWRSARPAGAVHFCIPYSTLGAHPRRAVFHHPGRQLTEPDRRWVKLLKAADPGRRPCPWWPSWRTAGCHGGTTACPSSPATSSNWTWNPCHPGQGGRCAGAGLPLRHVSNGRYALKVDQLDHQLHLGLAGRTRAMSS